MNLTRKHALAGLAATGIVASALAGGGVAIAATSPTPAPTATATAPSWCHHPIPSGHHTVMNDVAGYLGLGQNQLISELQSGKSLADVAKAQGKSVSALEDTILAAVTSRVNAIAGISAAQKKEAIAEVKSHLGDIVNATCPGTGTPMSPSPTGTK